MGSAATARTFFWPVQLPEAVGLTFSGAKKSLLVLSFSFVTLLLDKQKKSEKLSVRC